MPNTNSPIHKYTIANYGTFRNLHKSYNFPFPTHPPYDSRRPPPIFPCYVPSRPHRHKCPLNLNCNLTSPFKSHHVPIPQGRQTPPPIVPPPFPLRHHDDPRPPRHRQPLHQRPDPPPTHPIDQATSQAHQDRVHHRVHVLCNSSPVTEAPENAAKLIDEGLNVARLNFSHGDHAEHRRQMTGVLEAMTKRKNAHVAFMLDTKGPEIRTGNN